MDRIGSDPTVHDHLGDVYFKLGKTKEADAKGLHGKERKKFMSECKKAAADKKAQDIVLIDEALSKGWPLKRIERYSSISCRWS